MSKLVCVGQIINVHGIKGGVKIKPFLTDPMTLALFDMVTDKEGKKVFKLKVQSQNKGIVLAYIDGIKDRTQAELLKGTELYVEREKMPKEDTGEFYYIDLIGLTVLKAGEEFGTVESVENFGAGDIINVRLKNGKVFPFDFSEATFPVVDIENKVMHIELPVGIKEVLNHED